VKTATEDESGEHPCGDLGQVICLAAFMAVWILDTFYLGFSTFLARFVPLAVRLMMAGPALLLSFYLVRAAHGVIAHGADRSPALIKDGAFARLRHPLYGGSLLFYLSFVLASFSLIAGAVLAGVFFFYNFITAYEEEFLERKYGSEYREYRRKVPRWLPRLRAVRFD